MNITRIYVNLALIALLGLITACQNQGVIPSQMKVGKPYVIDGKSYYPQYDNAYDKTGEASWYGPGFHGKYTADGEVFDQNDITAAHPTLPMPCIVRVTNLENGKSELVRINDRGPFKSNRIIDLSKAAAEKLGIRSLARVRVQFLSKESDEFLASVQGGKPMTMAEFNDRPFTAPQIVETSVTTTTVDNPVSDAAPVMTVSSNDIAGSTPPVVETTTTTTVVTAAEAPDTGTIQPEEAVVQTDLIAPVAPAKQIHTLEPPAPANTKTKPVILTKNWASDTATLPEPDQAQPAGGPEPEQMDNDVNDADNEPPPPVKSAPAHVPQAAVPATVSSDSGHYIILAGAFASKENADKLVEKISDVSKANVALINVGGKSLWRVHVGPFEDKQSADDVLAQVRADGAPDARITHQ